jgi:hypothetical protein
MRARGFGQKVALLFAWLGYAAATAALFGCGYWTLNGDTSDPVFASLAASVVFFGGCGIVLHVIGSADLPDLRIDRHG